MPHTSKPRVRRALTALTLVLILSSFIPARRAHAAAGDLDPTFGTGGKVTADFFQSQDYVEDLLVQADGKIIAAGMAVALTGLDFALARYNADGSLDASFGNAGKVTTDFDQLENLTAAVLQPNGKIVAVGFTTSNGLDYYVVLARYNSNGSLDPTFGTGGKVSTNLTPGLDQSFGIALQADGKVVIAGVSPGPLGVIAFTIIRYNVNGSLDVSFGTSGVVQTAFGESSGDYGAAFDILVQPNGQIVAGGYAPDGGGNAGFALARYNADGSLDSTFGTGGKVVTNLGGSLIDQMRCLALQPDGKILAGGEMFDPNLLQARTALARYHPDGSLDTSFGTGGIVLGGATDYVYIVSLALQQSGRIVAAVNPFGVSPANQFAVLRYNADGTPDVSFGVDGRVTTSITNTDYSNAVAVQPDGKIIVGGSTGAALTGIDFALARFNGDAPPFDTCLQDESNGNLLPINTTTGEYQFTNCGGVALGGTGRLTRRGNTLTLQHNTADRRVLATVDTNTRRATASVQWFASGRTFSLTDRNTANNTCACR